MEKFDIVVFGATSFVGKILCDYLLKQCNQNNSAPQNQIRWAMAARSKQKLKQLVDHLGPEAKGIEQIIADSDDADSVKQMCESTKLVISTVGPYALYGESVVKACVSLGTDYCDLTGEPQFIANMISRYEKIAQATGARIIHSCGFDSVPSDLGVWFTQQNAQVLFNKPCQHIAMRVHRLKGAASGGTVASMVNLAKEVSQDKQLRKVLANPYALCPEQGRATAKQPKVNSASYVDEIKSWQAPFIMAAINERIVHRTNAMLEHKYSTEFTYCESMLMGDGSKAGLKAQGMTFGIGAFFVGAALPPSRWLMEKTFLPKPGEGPSPKAQLAGNYDMRFYGKTESGESLVCKVTGDRDPGYGSTAKILAQCGICMVNDVPKTLLPGGFWTPASAMAEPLIDRLRHYSGLTFEVLTPQR